MAPATNPAKTLQQNRVRPVVPRPVLPALPLSYVQKRKKDHAAFVKPKKEVVEEQTPITPTTSTTDILPSDTTNTSVVDEMVNGVEEIKIRETEDAKEVPSPGLTMDEPEEEAVIEPVAPVEQIDSSELQSVEPQVSKEDLPDSQSRLSSEAPSTSSRSTYQMPPPFVPASQMVAHSPSSRDAGIIPPTSNADSVNYPPFPPPMNAYHPQHHGHPSQSSLVFGGYPESNNSSPAPQSAGHFPPPSFSQNGYHAQHTAHHTADLSNGGYAYPHNGMQPMAPPSGYYPRQEHVTNGRADFPHRQMASHNTEGYSPIHTPHSGDAYAFAPPTPHSFQGSQTSGLNGDTEHVSATPNQYAVSQTNGLNGHAEQYKQPRAKRPVSHVPVNFPIHPDGQPPLPTDHFDGLVPYLQSQFSNTESADCSIELVSTENRYPPSSIPGHRLILARSPTFKEIMAKQASHNQYSQTLTIVSNSSYVRPDAFAMAVQRLYGWPLVDHTVLAAFAPHPLAHDARSYEDRFSLGLSYAFAGYLLKIPPVISRGLEIAAYHINWNTVEKAVQFNFETPSVNSLHESSHDQQVPGPILDIIHQAANNFLVASFPANFRLNTTVADSITKPRLPAVKHARPSNHSHQLSQIRFGEIGGEEIPDAVVSTLSQILINLPYPNLKAILESPQLGNNHGRIPTILRQEIMIAVIQERETRRVKAVESATPNSERLDRATEWEVAGWQEYVQLIGNNDPRPTLARTFVGFKSSS